MSGKAGRPKKNIDWKAFEKLAGLHCTAYEIASVLNIHPDTLRDSARQHYKEDFSSVYKRFVEVGNPSLRRDQRIMASKNCTMAIWLGKQWLGQRDHDDKEKVAPNDQKIDILLQGLQSDRALQELKLENDKLKAQIKGN